MCAAKFVIAGLLVTVGATPAFAQAPLPDIPSFCSATTAFGQTMGSKAVNGAARPSPGVATLVTVPPQFAPFTDASVVLSQYSREVNQVRASAKFADTATATRAAEAIRAQFRKAGWIEGGAKGLPEEAFNPLGDDVADFNSERGGLADPPTGRRVEIDTDGATVDVSCIDLPGWAKHVKEAFGPPPVGAERPTPPPALPANAPKIDCTKPLSETEKALTSDDQQMQEWLGQVGAANDYFEQLLEWNGQQFVKAGKWTDKQKKDFELQLLSRPELADNWAWFLNAPLRVMTDLGAIMKASDARNDAQACAAFNALFADVAEHGRRTMAHTEAIDRVYRAEAAKLGLTLD